MNRYQNIYDGITKAVWGYFFIYFNINISIGIGTVSLLPDFMGFLFFLFAIDYLKDEERDLALLRPLGILLAVWNGAEWIANWVAIDLNNASQFVNIIICLVNMYFHFQLLTNMASIAAKEQPDGEEFDSRLLKYRTVQTIMLTVMMIFSHLSTLFGELWLYVSLAMAVIYVIISVCIMKVLLDLRRCLPTDDAISEETTEE